MHTNSIPGRVAAAGGLLFFLFSASVQADCASGQAVNATDGSWESSVDAMGSDSHNFSLPADCRYDVTVRIEWDLIADDLDLEVTSPDDGTQTASSFSFAGPAEEVVFSDVAGGSFTADTSGFLTAGTSYRGNVTAVITGEGDGSGGGNEGGGNETGGSGAAPAAGPKPRVVVAVPDSGINPYHAYFREGSEIYPNGSPPNSVTDTLLYDFDIPESCWLSLTRTGDFNADYQADAGLWAQAASCDLVWFTGTNILAKSYDAGSRLILPDDEEDTHGVGTGAAVLAANPDAVLVFLEGTGDDASTFAFEHPHIDIVSTSYGPVGSAPMLFNLGGSFEGVVSAGKMHFGACDNSPSPAMQDTTCGPWWSIGVAGFEETQENEASEASNGRQLVSGTFPDFLADFTHALPYCAECETGIDDSGSVAGTSFSTPRSAGTASKIILEARRQLNQTGGIRLVDDKNYLAGDASLGFTNWQLRRALEAAAMVPNFEDYDPIQGIFDFFGGPVNPAAPWLQVGWGVISPLEETGVVQNAMIKLGFAVGVAPSKDTGFCNFQNSVMVGRKQFWDNQAGSDSFLNAPENDPYIWCESVAASLFADEIDTPPVDTDGDGVVDSEDNCPDKANSDQTDTDENGIGDACENSDGSLPFGRSQIWSAEGTAGNSAFLPPLTPATEGIGMAENGSSEVPVQEFSLNVPAGYDDLALLEVSLDWEYQFKDYFVLEVVAPDGQSAQSLFVNTNYQEVSLPTPKAGEYTVRVRENRTTGGAFALSAYITRTAPEDTVLPMYPINEIDAGEDDVVVIAVVDSGFNPYQWDYLSAHLPQHKNSNPADDLPLDQDPATWLSGHPGAAAFKSYQALNLTLDANDPARSTTDLHNADQAEWNKVNYSEGILNEQVNMYWVPGTKVIGHVTFSPGLIGDPVTSAVLGDLSGPVDTWRSGSHGNGSATVSAGNLHGSCARCVLVFVHGTSEQANQWIAKQDWIDLQTNSWGISATGALRDRIYAGSDTELQRRATERGQSMFFSAGNGLENAFVVPNPTLFSSQEGPDWIITVGAISPNDGASYTGHGRPSDIASVGSSYPSGLTDETNGDGTNDSDTFGGTSNATPVMAGIYGEALYRARRLLGGASRVQSNGLIGQGDPVICGLANAQCALGDGQLTVFELREALFRAAQYTTAGLSPAGLIGIPQTGSITESEYLSEGHGSYFGRLHGENAYEAEIQRIVGYLTGDWHEAQDPNQVNWFIADAVCRQSIWGPWNFGYDQLGTVGPDPAWPARSFMSEGCPQTLPHVVEVERTYASQFNNLDTGANDADDDGVGNSTDNCPNTRNADQKDSDGDGTGDACESGPTPSPSPTPSATPSPTPSATPTPSSTPSPSGSPAPTATPAPTQSPADPDGDGVDNPGDNCPNVANPDQTDTDGDGAGDACDSVNSLDPDGDGHENDVDNCPNTSNADQADSDGDGTGDACDAVHSFDFDEDGVKDADDNCPYDANSDQADSNQDGRGDACQEQDPVDYDGDGVNDNVDNCPTVPNSDQANVDGDEAGDACDAVNGNDPDGDGLDSNADNCPATPNPSQQDLDNDGIGDVCDPRDNRVSAPPPRDPYSQDIDGDGHENSVDNCPNSHNPSQTDSDGDGRGDVCDASNNSDIDGDGVANVSDNCPSTPNSSQSNADGDDFGDACDADFGEGGGVSKSAQTETLTRAAPNREIRVGSLSLNNTSGGPHQLDQMTITLQNAAIFSTLWASGPNGEHFVCTPVQPAPSNRCVTANPVSIQPGETVIITIHGRTAQMSSAKLSDARYTPQLASLPLPLALLLLLALPWRRRRAAGHALASIALVAGLAGCSSGDNSAALDPNTSSTVKVESISIRDADNAAVDYGLDNIEIGTVAIDN